MVSKSRFLKQSKMIDECEFFGDEAQIDRQRRYFRLWPFLSAHPRLSFVGRAIGIEDPALDEVETLVGLAMELGFLAILFVKATIASALQVALEERGLNVGIWQQLVSAEWTHSLCRSVLASRSLPPGYRIERVAAVTPAERLQAYQGLMQRCGVAPLPGCILRGQAMPAVAEMILSPKEEVLATGVTVMRHNPNGSNGKAAHVGFLATDPAQRGQGFAQLLLARVILASFEAFAAEFVYTGVRADNAPSQRVCRACGLEDSGMVCLGAAYPPAFEQAEFTR
jgi:RimJ/RimL family protein N-acetyltransferase